MRETNYENFNVVFFYWFYESEIHSEDLQLASVGHLALVYAQDPVRQREVGFYILMIVSNPSQVVQQVCFAFPTLPFCLSRSQGVCRAVVEWRWTVCERVWREVAESYGVLSSPCSHHSCSHLLRTVSKLSVWRKGRMTALVLKWLLLWTP